MTENIGVRNDHIILPKSKPKSEKVQEFPAFYVNLNSADLKTKSEPLTCILHNEVTIIPNQYSFLSLQNEYDRLDTV